MVSCLCLVTVADPGFTNGGKDEAPQAPRGLGVGRGVPSPLRGSGRRRCPSPEFFFDFRSQNGDFRCILDFFLKVQLFGLNAKGTAFRLGLT